MKSLITAAALAALLAACAAVQAQTLRWASQGDAQTMDPHSQNEGLTNQINGQVYEGLVTRDRQLNIVPALATSWEQAGPLNWRFKLRPNVRFHDGAPFTADDVVFSVNRAKEPTSQLSVYANALGTPLAVDPLTVEFRLDKANPIFLQHLGTLVIMSRAWSEKNKVTKPLDFKNKEESHASFNANGTGPYLLASRQPGIKTTFKRNAQWWGRFDGNVQEIVYTPIANDATRLAALVSGEIDFVLDPAPRDIARLRNTAGVKVIDGPENRIVFIGMDQARDKLLYGKRARRQEPLQGPARAPGAVPRDRHRDAEDQADERPELPHRRHHALAAGRLQRPATRDPPALRPGRGAGADGRGRLCRGLRGHARLPQQPLHQRRRDLHRAGRHVGADQGARSRSTRCRARPIFPKLEKLDTSLYLLGWGGAVTDAETTMTPVLRNRGDKGVGLYNYGGWQQRALRRAGGPVQRRSRPEEARRTGQGRAARVQGPGAPAAAAPPGDPLGGAQQRRRRAPRRQLARSAVGDAALKSAAQRVARRRTASM